MATILITNAEERSMLAVSRGLAAAGHRVIAAGLRRTAPTLWSRSPAARALHPDPGTDPAGFVAAVARLGARDRCAAVLPGSDVSLVALARARGELDLVVPVPEPASLERLLDKRRLLALAEEAGFGVPETIACETAAEVRDAGDRLGWPAVVKPASSIVISPDGRIRRVNSTVAGREDLPPLEGTVLVQRRLPGQVVSVAGVLHDGRLAGLAVSRYLRTWPAEAGSACCSETIGPPRGLAERTVELLVRIGCDGLFELEVLEDGPRHLVLDLNPRPYGSLALAIAAGANLPAIWVGALLGGPERPLVTARPGVRYRWEDAELRHAIGRLRGGQAAAALRQARPHRGTAHAHFRLRDPGPLLARAADLLAPGCRRTF